MSKLFAASLGFLLLVNGCAADTSGKGTVGATSGGVGTERIVTVSAFPIVRAQGGFGPDTLGTEGDWYVDYTHQYFCASTVTLRTEANPACTEGMQDCGKTLERAIRVSRSTCAAPGTAFKLGRVVMLGEGAIGGRDSIREDVLSGSCAKGFVLGRSTAHPIEVSFASAAACASIESLFAGQSAVTLELDLSVVTAEKVELVAAHVSP